jgi:phenylpropionate dioxygenase-like ring-hydroxylating dioxygenase large terminal subunit
MTVTAELQPGSVPSDDRPQASLGSYWHPIAMTSEIEEQPRRFMLLGEPVVAFRDDQGVAAFKDLCIHRGTALSLGHVAGGRIVCPYHGWEYDRTGSCVRIPALPDGSSIPRKARALAYRVQEAYGLVWVAMREPVAPIPGWPEDPWNDERFHVFLALRQTWKASAGRVVENAMDFSHFNFVHKGLTELADGPVIKPHAVERTSYGLHYEYHDSEITREYSLYAPFTLHDRKVQPNGDVSVLTLVAAPLDANTTHVYQFIARNHAGAVALQGKGREQAEAAVTSSVEVVMAQDRAIVESQRPEQIPLDLREELHIKVPDASGLAYRRLLAELSDAQSFMP